MRNQSIDTGSRYLSRQIPFYTPLTKEEQLLIRGGSHTIEQIMALFNTNLLNLASGERLLTPSEYNYFKDIIGQLNSTPIGYNLLDALVTTGGHIDLVFKPNSGEDAFKKLDVGQGKLDLGFLLDPWNGSPAYNSNDISAENFLSISHELFHAYQYFNVFPAYVFANVNTHTPETSAYFTSTRVELEASLFAAMAVKEHDSSIPAPIPTGRYEGSLLYSGNWTENPNALQANNILDTAMFDSAWAQIIDNHSFSVSNYNILIDTFFTGSTYPVNYANFQIHEIDQSSVATDMILNFFGDNYFTNFSSLNQGGGGSGGSNTSNDFTNTNTFWIDLWWASVNNQSSGSGNTGGSSSGGFPVYNPSNGGGGNSDPYSNYTY